MNRHSYSGEHKDQKVIEVCERLRAVQRPFQQQDRIRIVHVYKDIYPVVGGIENHIRLLCRELARHPDFDLTILVTNVTSRSTIDTLDGVSVIKTGRLVHVASTPISPRLLFELQRLRPDIIHLHFPYPPGELAALLVRPPAPIVMTYHSDVVRQKLLLRAYTPLLKRVLQRATRILPTSPVYLERSPWLRDVRDRCLVVPLGIDLQPFLSVDRASDGHTLLFVGRFRYYKGLHYLIEALQLIPNARLILVGSGPLESALRKQIQDLGLEARVEFATDVADSDLPAYYARADLFVLPACEPSEAFGLVLVEALASGLPCVSTELGTGTSYVNAHEQTGLIVPPGDPQALAHACQRLLADATLRARFGTAGRMRAETLFDIRRVATQVATLYRDIVNADPAQHL